MVNHRFLVDKMILKSPSENKIFHEEDFSPPVFFDFTLPKTKDEGCEQGRIMKTLHWRDSYSVKF